MYIVKRMKVKAGLFLNIKKIKIMRVTRNTRIEKSSNKRGGIHSSSSELKIFRIDNNIQQQSQLRN